MQSSIVRKWSRSSLKLAASSEIRSLPNRLRQPDNLQGGERDDEHPPRECQKSFVERIFQSVSSSSTAGIVSCHTLQRTFSSRVVPRRTNSGNTPHPHWRAKPRVFRCRRQVTNRGHGEGDQQAGRDSDLQRRQGLKRCRHRLTRLFKISTTGD